MVDLKGFVVSEEISMSRPKIISGAKTNNSVLNEGMTLDDDQPIVFKAELQEADAPNRNNRIYTKRALEEALNHYSVKEKIANKSWYGKTLPFITAM